MRMLFVFGIAGCKNAKDTMSVATDTAIVSEPLPPAPFTLEITGAANETLLFDTPTCSIPEAMPRFDLFWRNDAKVHVFVIRLSITNEYTGAGEYSNETHNVSLKLQEEAGGGQQFFQSNSQENDIVHITIESDDEETLWGEFSATTLHNGSDVINLNPTQIPIWCDPENTQR